MECKKDYLLDKQIAIYQSDDGYRASTDAVLLQALITNVKKGDKILDVGSGTGAISLCLAHRFGAKGVQITGIEKQPMLAQFSAQSAKENGFDGFLQYVTEDIMQKKSSLPNCYYQHVITNPPYAQKDMKSPKQSKAQAHNFENMNLTDWINFCIKKIHPKGFFYMINRAEALSEIICAIDGKLGNIKIIPIFSKADDQNAKRVLVMAQKDNATALQIKKPLVLHKKDGGYNRLAGQILRKGKAIEI